jgi:hypothetical protein
MVFLWKGGVRGWSEERFEGGQDLLFAGGALGRGEGLVGEFYHVVDGLEFFQEELGVGGAGVLHLRGVQRHFYGTWLLHIFQNGQNFLIEKERFWKLEKGFSELRPVNMFVLF